MSGYGPLQIWHLKRSDLPQSSIHSSRLRMWRSEYVCSMYTLVCMYLGPPTRLHNLKSLNHDETQTSRSENQRFDSYFSFVLVCMLWLCIFCISGVGHQINIFLPINLRIEIFVMIRLRRRCALMSWTRASNESFDYRHASGEHFFLGWVGFFERRCRTPTAQGLYTRSLSHFHRLRVLLQST